MRVLGEDDHGVWGCCDVGEQIYKAGEPAFVRSSALLALIPRDECWSASWHPPSEHRLEVYIDINTEPNWTGSTVSMIDLDLDVLRHRDGTVELLDEDEFEEHRVIHDYPPDLVSLARDAAAATMALASAPAEPFDRAWRHWYATVHEL
jgi:protein associated with RNAse G/E